MDETAKALEKAQIQAATIAGELKRLQESANIAERSILVENDDRARELQNIITVLQLKNRALVTDADEILARYRERRLVTIYSPRMWD